MRFSIAALMLISSTETWARFPPYSATGKSLEEFTKSEQSNTREHSNVHHIQSWQGINRRNFRERNMRTSSSFRGLLRNTHLPERSIECSLQDHQQQDADVGILSSCPRDSICVAHPESSQGGFCQHRNLQQDLITDDCRSESRFAALPVDESCDCSAFDTTSHQGSFACLVYSPEHCFQQDICGSLTVKQTFNEYDKTEYCYGFQVPLAASVCYQYSVNIADPDQFKSCSISVDGVNCNYCRVIDGGIDGIENGCLEIDCSNTAAAVAGSDCLGGLVVAGLLRDFIAAPTTVLPTTSPTSRPFVTGDSVSVSLQFPSAMPTPAPTSSSTTAFPTFSSLSTRITDQPSHEPEFSLTMPPAMSFPRFSLTAPPAMVFSPQPTLTLSPSFSDASNSTAPPSDVSNSTAPPTDASTSSSLPSDESNSTALPTEESSSTAFPSDESTTTAFPSDTSNPTAPTSNEANTTTPPTSTPTLMPTTTAAAMNETRGPGDVSSISGTGSSPSSAAAVRSYPLDTKSTIFSLVIVILASLVRT